MAHSDIYTQITLWRIAIFYILSLHYGFSIVILYTLRLYYGHGDIIHTQVTLHNLSIYNITMLIYSCVWTEYITL